jgi:hypothetical protein
VSVAERHERWGISSEGSRHEWVIRVSLLTTDYLGSVPLRGILKDVATIMSAAMYDSMERFNSQVGLRLTSRSVATRHHGGSVTAQTWSVRER